MPRTKNLDLTQGIIWKQLLLFLPPSPQARSFSSFIAPSMPSWWAAFSAPTPWPL